MRLNRREMVTGVAGTALAAAAAATPFALGGAHTGATEDAHAGHHGGEAPAVAHTERYQGRTIQVLAASAGGGVLIDGQPLHLMKYADDAYLSSLCHYEMAPSPLHAARRAVEELRGAALLPTGHGTHVTTV